MMMSKEMFRVPPFVVVEERCGILKFVASFAVWRRRSILSKSSRESERGLLIDFAVVPPLRIVIAVFIAISFKSTSFLIFYEAVWFEAR